MMNLSQKPYIRSLLLICAIAIGVSVSHAQNTIQTTPKTHDVAIRKVNKQFAAVQSKDSNNAPVEAKPGDKITFSAEGTDIYIQFMDVNLTGQTTLMVKKGTSVTVTVSDKAKKGENAYAVFCTSDMSFAKNMRNSPPVIIIK
jgi:plastocyanin